MFAKSDPEQRGNLALLLIGAFVFITLFSVNFLSQINLSQGTWQYPEILPTMTPVGWDFRDGLYKPAQKILAHQPVLGIYPPLAYVFGLPFVLTMSADQGYIAQIILLFLCNIAVIFLSLRLAAQFFYPKSTYPVKKTAFAGLFLLMFMVQFFSYGFAYSIERGNYDIFAIFFGLLGLWLLVKYPKTIIWQVICISIAAHLKIYPAVLFLLLFWKHRFNFILPALLINSLLLLVLGPQTAISFLQTLLSFTSTNAHYWAGNHSTTSFLFYFGIPVKSILGVLLTFVPLIIWLASAIFLLPGGYSEEKALWGFMISVPLMNVVPAISNDYKLVILITTLCMFLYVLLMRFIQTGRLKPILLISFSLILFFYIEISYALVPPVLQNKWPFIVIFQIVLLLALPGFEKYKGIQNRYSPAVTAA